MTKTNLPASGAVPHAESHHERDNNLQAIAPGAVLEPTPAIPSIAAHARLTDDGFLSGSGEMAALIRSLDWSRTALGPIDAWPQSLRTTVSLCLASNFPINIVWGPQHVQIYNDGYRVVCGDKHPAALGMDYTQCWASAWPAIGGPFAKALQGQTSFLENQRMFLFRNGYLEETFFTFSLSPIRDESAGIGGLFHPVTETTPTMVGERRTRAVRDLTVRLGDADQTAQVYALTIDTLAGFAFDLPFVQLYRLDTATQTYHRAAQTGIADDSPLAPAILRLDDSKPWPMAELIHRTLALEQTGLRALLGDAACGPYEEAPDSAFALPIRQPGVDLPVALLIAGASARLPMTEEYRGFYDLLAAAFEAALGRVAAFEEERRRREILAAVDRAKTRFFSNVSHEFRTPLTLMLGPLEEALEAADLAPAQRERLQIANRNALRLLKMVNSLLDFSRIEAGRIDARFMPVDLAALTSELASSFRSACQRAGLELIVECDPLPAGQMVYVDPEMWEKIVLNLLSNAFKFTLEGRIRVSLRAGQEIDAGRVLLQVIDTGVGIPAPELPRIFERFHRVEGQRGRSVEGTGIGLSLVRELVQLHGGGIDAAHAPQQGTIFTVRLPLGASHLPPEQVQAASAPHAASGSRIAETLAEALRWLPEPVPDPIPASMHESMPESMVGSMVESRSEPTPADASAAARPLVAGMAAAVTQPAGAARRILLADDNADMRAYIRRILEEGGHAVEAVDNGAAALEAIRRGPLPDLVLSDVMMPELDGFGLLQAVRAQESTRSVVMILLSARAGVEARIEGLAAGADDYMVKPFGARELLARVDGAISLARLRHEAIAREQALLAAVREIAARKQTQARLKDTAERLQFTLEAAQIGDWDLDLVSGVASRSWRHDQCFGYHQAVPDWNFDIFLQHVHPADREDVARRFREALADLTNWHFECRVVWPDDSIHWIAAHGSIYHVDTRPTRMGGIVYDITERRQAEEELREAARRKDEFLAMLAHELRNPLAPISAAAELMSRVSLDKQRLQKTSAVIARQVRHMTGLVDDLLDVSRVTRGLVTIRKAPLEVRGVVANALEQVRPMTEARRQRLVTDLAPEVGLLEGDFKRLVQSVTNLLNNASKYTPEGGTVYLRTEVDPDAAQMRIIVQDSGIGIAPELQARIFDLFAQAERTPDRSQGGLGLGLALVRSLIELHGGQVTCFSEGVGKGSCFTLTLPLLARTEAIGHAPPAPPPPLADRAPALRILVVDDNADAADMLTLLLESNGHAVMVEHESRRALERARIETPDVAILDIGLPDMDGNELARRLRAEPKNAGMLLVAVTGYGQELDRSNALDAGFDHHLVKPVDTAVLTALLAQESPRRTSPSTLAGRAMREARM